MMRAHVTHRSLRVCSHAHASAELVADHHNGHPDGRRCGKWSAPVRPPRAAILAPKVARAGAVESVAFLTGSGAPWTWSCASCAPAGCSIIAPNKQLAVPLSAACSGTVRLALSTSLLGIGDGPGSYADNADCTWLISASGPITVRFDEFSTEPGYDYVKLYDGASPSAPLLAGFSGGSFSGGACTSPFPCLVPPAVTSTGGSLAVRFTSDVSTVGVNTSAGFTATLSSASVVAAMLLVGTVPATLGDLRCAGSVKSMCAPSPRSPTQRCISWDVLPCARMQ
jgi:hypothetical protein